MSLEPITVTKVTDHPTNESVKLSGKELDQITTSIKTINLLFPEG